MRIGIYAVILACAAAAGLFLAGTYGSASATTAAKVMQNCGHDRACASRRPSSFDPGYGLKIDRITWHTYTSSEAVGWGRFGKRWICGGNVISEKMTCVKITLTDPVSSHGIRYFSHLFLQPATMGGHSSWSWRTARYLGQF